MPLLKELGTAVRRRRAEIGLSQQELAELVELSRATVNELESGKLKDLSATRLEKLANGLGFAVGLVNTRSRGSDKTTTAISAAATLASVPYKHPLPPELLKQALKERIVPPGFIPHMRHLLQEAPIAVLADAAQQIEHEFNQPAKQTWANMRTLASVLKCDRAIWQTRST